MKTRYNIVKTPAGIVIVDTTDLIPLEIPEKTSELINDGNGTKEFLIKDGLTVQNLLDAYYGNTDWRTAGTPSASAIETALDAYYGNAEWRDATLTASDIEGLLDTYYGGTDWRTGGSGDVSTDTIWDNAGDIVVGSGADTATKLAMGTALQVLQVNAGATALEWGTSGAGDMTKAVFDPTSQNADAFLMSSMQEDTDANILTDAERTAISDNSAKVTFDATASGKVANISITQPVDLDTMESDIATNNAKTGITTQQGLDIISNNAKVGITPAQTSDITTNNSKVSFPEAPNDGEEYVRKNEAWSISSGGTTSPLTTKGDIYTYDTGQQRLAIGADGTVLTADSAEATGLKWATPAGGGDVLKVGTPLINQIGVWTGDGTIQGLSTMQYERVGGTDDELRFTGDIFKLKVAGTDLFVYNNGDGTFNLYEDLIVNGTLKINNNTLYNSTGDAITIPSTTSSLAINYLTTKGDLLTFGSVNARLPIGNDGEVLTADSAEQNGMKWESPTDAVLSKSVTMSDTYTVLLGDEAGLIDMTAVTDKVATIDTYAQQAIPVGSILMFRQASTGSVIVENYNNTIEYGRTYYKDQTIALWHESTDNWIVLNPSQSKQYDGWALSASDGTPANATVITDRIVGTKIYKDVRVSLTTAETTNTLTLDVKKNGTSIFATTLTVDATELTSTTATTAFDFTASAGHIVFLDDDKIEFVISNASDCTGAIVKMIE